MADNYIEVLSTPNFRNGIHFAEKNKLGFNPIIITDATVVNNNVEGSRQNIILSQIPTPQGTNRQPIYLLGCGGNQGQKSGIIIASGENGALIWSNMSLINNLDGIRYNPANSEDVILSADGKVLLYSNMNTEAKTHEGFTARRLEFGADGVFRITEQDFPARESDEDVQNWPSQPVSRPFVIQYNVGDSSKTITVVDEYGKSNFENITTKEIIIKDTSASAQAEISITNTDIKNKSFPYKTSGATNTTTSLNAIIKDISDRLDLLGFNEGNTITVAYNNLTTTYECGWVARLGRIIYGKFAFTMPDSAYNDYVATTFTDSSNNKQPFGENGIRFLQQHPPIENLQISFYANGSEANFLTINTDGEVLYKNNEVLVMRGSPLDKSLPYEYSFYYELPEEREIEFIYPPTATEKDFIVIPSNGGTILAKSFECYDRTEKVTDNFSYSFSSNEQGYNTIKIIKKNTEISYNNNIIIKLTYSY